jgi:hypothetical protein
MSTVPDPREAILKAIRESAKGSRGKSGALVNLNDKILWSLYSRMRSSHSDKSIARWLHESGSMSTDSVESTSKLLGRFRRRISHLLVNPVPAKVSVPEHRPLPQVSEAVRSGDLPQIEELKVRYGRVIDSMLREAEADPSAISPHLPKHVQALAQLEKAALKVQEDLRKRPKDQGLTLDRRSRADKFDRIMKEISDPQAVRRAMDRVLERVDDYIVTLVINEDQSYGVAPRTDAERVRSLSFGECGGLGVRPEAKENEKHGSNFDVE